MVDPETIEPEEREDDVVPLVVPDADIEWGLD